MKKIILFIFIIECMLNVNILAIKAQDPSLILCKSRLESTFYKNVDIYDEFLKGNYMLCGKATGTAMTLDSISISQQISIDVSFQSTFKLFGQLEVSVSKYDEETIILNPTDPKVSTIILLDGVPLKNYPRWVLKIKEISTSGNIYNLNLLAVQTFPTPKKLAVNQIIDGPYGLKLIARATPSYTQLELSARQNASIKTVEGDLNIPNAVWVGKVIRDNDAKYSPYNKTDQVDFYAVDKGNETCFSDCIMDTYSTMIYTRDSVAIANDKACVINSNGAINVCGPAYSWAPGHSLYINSGFKPRAKDPTLQRNIWTNGKDSAIYIAFKMKLDPSRRYIVPDGIFKTILLNLETNSETELDSNLNFHKSKYDSFVTTVNHTGDTILITSTLRDSNCIDAVWFRGSYTKDSTVSVLDHKLTGFDIYPNSAGDYIIINYVEFNPAHKQGVDNHLEIMIYNTLGEIVLKAGTSVESSTRIDISNLPKGIYFVKVGTELIKFVKI